MTLPHRLLWALLLSALAHALLLLLPAPRPPTPPSTPPLLARLEPMPPAPPAAKLRAGKATVKAAPPRRLTPPAPEPPEAQGGETPRATINQEEPAAISSELAAEADAPSVAGEARLPGRIVIDFTLIRGEQGLVVGRMRHEWQVTDDQYTLTSTAEATGVFSLFLPGVLLQVSRGLITPEGLKPLSFWIQRGQRQDRTESASFDWGAGSLRFGRSGEEKTVPLPAGSQDVLSVFYQLALTAPHNGVLELPVTNGRKFDRYRYRVVGEETLDTPLGPLVTERLERIQAPGEDALTLWLARDYHWLPVRLRFVDRRGEVAEQVVDTLLAQ
ncbi:MAG: DUF3108 domain-containing protein [Burkholderiales bacterium]|nr:DUF3108 domain-containing protein [Burkholderiales bacterium]